MVSESFIMTKVSIHKKVSKPLMEKKRRARINMCLDQLKTLLENLYSNNIRKRKLEKADILELTVKHLKHLQKVEKGFSVNSGVGDYQAGYSTCLASVSHYLLMSDANTACRSTMLSHLSRGLLCPGAPGRNFSTKDSDSSRAPGDWKEHHHGLASYRTEICAKNQKPAHGLSDPHNRSSSAPLALQQNYWRPW